MIVDEKFLEFLDKLFAQIVDMFYVGINVILQFGGNDAVLALRIFLVLTLLTFDNPHRPALYEATRVRRFIHEHQDVDRISILRFSRGYEAEVMRKSHPSWQYLLQ